MYGFLVMLHIIVCILLICVILMQASKGGGLAGTFGGATSSAVFGGRGAGNFLTKLTAGLAIAFMMLAILISLVNVPSNTASSIVQEKASERVSTPGEDLPRPLSLPEGQPQ